jgi:NADH-quinone oxidoreductase subunit M
MPKYAGLLLFFSLASLGLPGLSGFVAEFLALVGAFGPWRWQTSVSVLGIVVAAAYMLKVVRQVLLGPVNERWRSMPDMKAVEVVSTAPLLILVLALGVMPLALLKVQEPAVQQLIHYVLGR